MSPTTRGLTTDGLATVTFDGSFTPPS
jgi:hypothetical protein